MSDTSQEAFRVALRGSKQLAYRLYLQIQDAGQHGVTRDDLVQTFTAMGVDQSTITARVRALVASKLVTDGPDHRPTRKSNPAKVVRAIQGRDFSSLYNERAGRAPNFRCSVGEREFLDYCRKLTTRDRESANVSRLLWGAFVKLRDPGKVA